MTRNRNNQMLGINKEERSYKVDVCKDNWILKLMLSIAFPLFDWLLLKVNKTPLVKKLTVDS